ncbi:Hemin import ATP-binding protein HmuV [Vibrio aerogenes CECT 7868]|uniref:Hemin import ATP-binding protein HmuV n=1 Tax=Vibrio aerogenes CECT 7868 TaxID=1216006 RepID=A0A1M6C9S7_9VIBR|nr:ABC transporter ATP-binding protein [Vibrio aerogenes]SHI57775.1 Hemin import ATP-binding protein HmuV [Vibrio aerogenes CECT 7868]
MLTVKHLNIQLDQLTLADDMNFAVQQGQVNVIIGPNGTGKSTLLKALFGDMVLQSGEFQFRDTSARSVSVATWRQLFGYMPQDIRLDIGLKVIEVVLLGRLDALSLRIDDLMLQEAMQILDQLGLTHLADRDVRTLSGGQCQMILFAQALMRCPDILMLDEPVSALDLHYQHVLLEHLAQQTLKHNYVTLMVLHDLNLAAQYADHLIVLSQGKIVVQGAPADVISAALIDDVYGVKAEVSYDSQNIPFVRTLRTPAELSQR